MQVIDSSRYRICISCNPPHIENCETCFGFGVKPSSSGSGQLVPVRAAEAPTLIGVSCPECSSTTHGVTFRHGVNVLAPASHN